MPEAGWTGVDELVAVAAGAGRACSESVASSVCTLTEPDVEEPVIVEAVVAVVDADVVDGVSGTLILESARPSSSESEESSAEPAVAPPGACAVIALASARKSMGASSPAAAVLGASPAAASCCCCCSCGLLAAPFLDGACVGVRVDLAFKAAGGDEEEDNICADGDMDEAGASARALVNSDHESSLSVEVPRFPASPAPPAAALSAFVAPVGPSNFDQSESNKPAINKI